MAKIHSKRAKRATRPNPREDRNYNMRGGDLHLSRNTPKQNKKDIRLVPRNIAQEEYIEALFDEDQYLVFAMGPAGCGKTMIATLHAIQGFQDGLYKKIVITRPAVSVDEQHGFLPGGLFEKMQPWVMPILDVFKEVGYTPNDITSMIECGDLEIAPLAYMRGRTFKDSIIIFDEAQNSSPAQTKMVLTRIGENSRMIITGDLRQHDRGFDDNGLKDFVERLSGTNDNITVIEFEPEDVERHPVIEQVLRIYDQD